MMKFLFTLLCCCALLSLGVVSAPPPEDMILAWNDVALRANMISHTFPNGEQKGPVLGTRALAIVHLAMYEAYAAGLGFPDDLPAYGLNIPPFPVGGNPDAAIIGASYHTLSWLFPSQTNYFSEQMNFYLNSLPFEGRDSGYTFGEAVAQAMIAERQNDPTATSAGYVPSNLSGHHRVDPNNPGQGYYAPYYGALGKGFAVTKRYELERPPFNNGAYRRDVKNVREKGIAFELIGTLPKDSSPRTPTQSMIGTYWGYDGQAWLGTPPRLYNQIVRVVAEHRKNTQRQNARLFALVNTAMGDAALLCWDQKYIHNFWRPCLAIREHGKNVGPDARVGDNKLAEDSDPYWLPLGAPSSNSHNKQFTPPFPAYPSGHATFGSAALQATRLFYGVKPGDRKKDKLFDGLTFVSDEFNGTTTDNLGCQRPRIVRSFPGGLYDMIIENGISRVYLGVHWTFDSFATKKNGDVDLSQPIGGVYLGSMIADDIWKSGMKLNKAIGPRV